jgi:hypothetical protein
LALDQLEALRIQPILSVVREDAGLSADLEDLVYG